MKLKTEDAMIAATQIPLTRWNMRLSGMFITAYLSLSNRTSR